MELLRALTLGLAPNAPLTPWTAFLTQGHSDPHLFRYVANELGSIDMWTLASHVPGLEKIRNNAYPFTASGEFPDARTSYYSDGILYNVQYDWEYMCTLMDRKENGGIAILYAVLGLVDHVTLDRLIRYCYLNLRHAVIQSRLWLRLTIFALKRIEYLPLLDLVFSTDPDKGVVEARYALERLIETSFEFIPFPFLMEACHLLDYYPGDLAILATCYKSVDIMEHLVGKIPANSCSRPSRGFRATHSAALEFFLDKFASSAFWFTPEETMCLPWHVADPFRFAGAKSTNIPSVCRLPK